MFLQWLLFLSFLIWKKGEGCVSTDVHGSRQGCLLLSAKLVGVIGHGQRHKQCKRNRWKAKSNSKRTCVAVTGSSENCFRGWLPTARTTRHSPGTGIVWQGFYSLPAEQTAVERKLLYLESRGTPNVLQWVNSYKLDHTHTTIALLPTFNHMSTVTVSMQARWLSLCWFYSLYYSKTPFIHWAPH